LLYLLLIIIKGIFRAYNPAGTFLLPMSNFLITILLRMVTLLFLLILFRH